VREKCKTGIEKNKSKERDHKEEQEEKREPKIKTKRIGSSAEKKKKTEYRNTKG